MRPVSPVIPDRDLPEIMIAENQEEYQTLPAIRCDDGCIVTRWKLSEEEIKRIVETGDIYLIQWNFKGPITPILLQVETPTFEGSSEYKDEILESEVIK